MNDDENEDGGNGASDGRPGGGADDDGGKTGKRRPRSGRKTSAPKNSNPEQLILTEATPRATASPGANGTRSSFRKTPMPPSDDTGFGHPPKEHQYQPGQSGNPRGRPVGAKTRRFGLDGHKLYDALGAELGRPVKYKEDGEDRQMPAFQAIIRTMTTKAVKGSVEAGRMLLHFANDQEKYERRSNEKIVGGWAAYKADGNRRIEALGPDPSPDDLASIPLPHADHIDYDLATGQIVISGPMNAAERVALEMAVKERADIGMAMRLTDERIRTTRSARIRADMQEALRKMEDRVMYLNSVLGDEEDDAGT